MLFKKLNKKIHKKVVQMILNRHHLLKLNRNQIIKKMESTRNMFGKRILSTDPKKQSLNKKTQRLILMN